MFFSLTADSGVVTDGRHKRGHGERHENDAVLDSLYTPYIPVLTRCVLCVLQYVLHTTQNRHEMIHIFIYTYLINVDLAGVQRNSRL